jgi:hypothetical protein
VSEVRAHLGTEHRAVAGPTSAGEEGT